MSTSTILSGLSTLQTQPKTVTGGYTEIEGEKFYRISNYDEMPPFFMTIVSASDHWMFLSSNGALSAGRKDRENALFPYYTDDKIHDSPELTGSKTIVRATKDAKQYLWEPFSDKYSFVYTIERNIYKNIYGNKIIFEEVNKDLGLCFRYAWSSSDKYGFVKHSKISNTDHQAVSIQLLDGVQNILPYGVGTALQTNFSTLVDAYKKCELLPESGIGVYFLSSIPTDRAEPSEGLKASTVWSVGLPESKKLVSSVQLDRFRRTGVVEQELDIRAFRGAYFVNANLELSANQSKEWYLVAEVNQDLTHIAQISKLLKENKQIPQLLLADIQAGTEKLIEIVGSADGLQHTADELSASRHFANVLFNVMRGGIFDNAYQIDKTDLLAHFTQFNTSLASTSENFVSKLPDNLSYNQLINAAAQSGNHDLMRLSYEYLPLTFSRRHGDPSRPWNQFSIQLKKEDGSKILFYQGNWRDIFQNWEALSLSYPGFIEGMITKFVNASTADGYNPYRITRNGIDWEVIDHEDPWSNIGYWGDHQIIYLLKLLEVSAKHRPEKLSSLLTTNMFAYANVPYKIKPYAEIVKNAQDTIVFDDELEAKIKSLVKTLGSDAKLILGKSGDVYKVNLTEKLLVSLLAKLSNFIPEAGIWLSTQRPEWNDANNALVGNGVSMVTLYYIRRFLSFSIELFQNSGNANIEFSAEVADLYNNLGKVFKEYQPVLQRKFTNKERKAFTDAVGTAGSVYREQIYQGFSENKTVLSSGDLVNFCALVLEFTDHSIRANKRADSLYHAYNLIRFDLANNELSVRYLYEMLEGQVAVLHSGFLSTAETVELLDALKASAMFRPDQYSYTLYPDRQLPRFTEKNNIPLAFFEKSELLQQLIRDNNRDLVVQGVDGTLHFNGTVRNAEELSQKIDKLSKKYQAAAQAERQAILDTWETMFDHQSFTGRSGTFYGYEGLGSIYWHMVSKLLLTVNEGYFWAVENKADKTLLNRLVQHYYEIRAGIGLGKSPELYGAFPTDPYSHTPGNAGAQQPGMTGQVKEDVLNRFGELGIFVENGRIGFKPALLRKSEFISKAANFGFIDVHQKQQTLSLKPGTLAFTYAQVPVVYHLSDEEYIQITGDNQVAGKSQGLWLSTEASQAIFERTGAITQLDVFLQAGLD